MQKKRARRKTWRPQRAACMDGVVRMLTQQQGNWPSCSEHTSRAVAYLFLARVVFRGMGCRTTSEIQGLVRTDALVLLLQEWT